MYHLSFYSLCSTVEKKVLYRYAKEIRQAEKPPWLAFHYPHMLSVEFLDRAFVIVTKLNMYVALGASFAVMES